MNIIIRRKNKDGMIKSEEIVIRGSRLVGKNHKFNISESVKTFRKKYFLVPRISEDYQYFLELCYIDKYKLVYDCKQ